MNNWDFHGLQMDYSSMYEGNDHPSDIDMFYLGRKNFLILCEFKNERGELRDGQRKLLEKLINGWKYDGLVIFAQHDQYVQYGGTKVDVPELYISEMYYKCRGKWEIPKRPTQIKEVIKYFKGEKR